MAQEIERKFLVNGKVPDGKTSRITQGYLSTVKERTVRVRIIGESGFLTIKGIGNESGMTRFEFEKEIPIQDALDLLKICEPGIIDKTRTMIEFGEHTLTVDRFCGENQGLVVAEVELEAEDEIFEKPNWLGKEVTGDVRYYNSKLTKKPYTKWKK
tara:strand:- start:208 stop:675 length:468 start_codon:yes stop_codon:yes gene_type:complete